MRKQYHAPACTSAIDGDACLYIFPAVATGRDKAGRAAPRLQFGDSGGTAAITAVNTPIVAGPVAGSSRQDRRCTKAMQESARHTKFCIPAIRLHSTIIASSVDSSSSQSVAIRSLSAFRSSQIRSSPQKTPPSPRSHASLPAKGRTPAVAWSHPQGWRSEHLH